MLEYSMTVKLQTAHHFGFLSLKGAAQAHLSQHLSKCHFVGNLMPRIKSYMGLDARKLDLHAKNNNKDADWPTHTPGCSALEHFFYSRVRTGLKST